jgi:hypothetical protein
MFSSLRTKIRGGNGGREPNGAVTQDDSEFGEVRYRPLLVNQVIHGHQQLRMLMRGVLTACSRRDEAALISGLQAFAELFRALALLKSSQVFPYVRWGLHNDRSALLILDSVQHESQRSTRIIEAVLSEYLGTPWNSEHRRRIVADASRTARHLAETIGRDETSVLPHYMSPGQYRYVGIPAAFNLSR